jgi:glycosyltransferase involved in cell wall biosynthesis
MHYAQQDERIIVTGCVDDVRVYVQRFKVFVVPLRIGGGTRLKILEAMSMEKAVVSTLIGAEGIHYKENEHIMIADTPETFRDKVIFLLDNDQKRKAIGAAGRKLVLEKYDWNIIGSALGEVYERLKA